MEEGGGREREKGVNQSINHHHRHCETHIHTHTHRERERERNNTIQHNTTHTLLHVNNVTSDYSLLADQSRAVQTGAVL